MRVARAVLVGRVATLSHKLETTVPSETSITGWTHVSYKPGTICLILEYLERNAAFMYNIIVLMPDLHTVNVSLDEVNLCEP